MYFALYLNYHYEYYIYKTFAKLRPTLKMPERTKLDSDYKYFISV